MELVSEMFSSYYPQSIHGRSDLWGLGGEHLEMASPFSLGYTDSQNSICTFLFSGLSEERPDIWSGLKLYPGTKSPSHARQPILSSEMPAPFPKSMMKALTSLAYFIDTPMAPQCAEFL